MIDERGNEMIGFNFCARSFGLRIKAKEGNCNRVTARFIALVLPTVWGNGVVQVVEFPRHNSRFSRRQRGFSHWNKLCKVLLQHTRSQKQATCLVNIKNHPAIRREPGKRR